jgi:hypothetical protein
VQPDIVYTIFIRVEREGEIRAGLDPEGSVSTPSTALTVGDVMDRYLVSYVGQHLRVKSARQVEYQLRMVRTCDVPAANGRTIRFEQKPIAGVTKADLEAFGRLDVRTESLAAIGCSRDCGISSTGRSARASPTARRSSAPASRS